MTDDASTVQPPSPPAAAPIPIPTAVRLDQGFILALLAIGGFIATIMVLIFHEMSPGSKDIVNIAIGTEGALALGAGAFWWGSNKSSQVKDQAIVNLTQGPTP